MKKIDLDHMNKQHPFTVPDGYFEHLEKAIQSEIRGKKSGFNLPVVLKWSLVPAMIVSIFIGIQIFKQNSEPSANQLIAELNTSEILNYLETSGISDDELTEITSHFDETMENLNPLEELNIEENEIDQLINEYDLIDLNIEEI